MALLCCGAMISSLLLLNSVDTGGISRHYHRTKMRFKQPCVMRSKNLPWAQCSRVDKQTAIGMATSRVGAARKRWKVGLWLGQWPPVDAGLCSRVGMSFPSIGNLLLHLVRAFHFVLDWIQTRFILDKTLLHRPPTLVHRDEKVKVLLSMTSKESCKVTFATCKVNLLSPRLMVNRLNYCAFHIVCNRTLYHTFSLFKRMREGSATLGYH